MALPANTTTVVVRGTFLTPEGNPSTGTVTFTPSAWLLNSGANIAIPNSGVSKTLGTAGDFSVTLPITDDPDLSPSGFVYTVAEVVDGVSQSYNISIPGTVATGGTIYLADLAPVAAAGPEYYSLASSLSIGTVTTLAAGSAATATITGLAPSQTLNLGIPTGPTGSAGSAATVTVGTVGAVAYPGPGTVTNSGSSSAAILDFVLVTGQTGATGATGPTGTAATVTVGTVGSVAYPGPGTVTNSGTSGSAVLDFILVTGQQGATGPQGAAGSAATIAVGSVTSVPYGGTASVTNVGSSQNGTFNFVVVQGPQGAIGDLAATAPLDYTSSTFSLRYGAGLGTATGGTLVADFYDSTPAALAAAGSAGSSTELARGDHIHARPTAAEVGAVGTATTITAGTGLAGGGDLSASRTLNVTLSDATPAAVGTPAAGTAVTPSRADHVHEGTTLSSATPLALGTATAGTATTASRGDHRHAMPSASDVGAVANSLLTAKASIVTATAASTPAALAVGTNGQVLKANSATATGLEWGDDLGIPATLIDAKGDLIAGSANDTAARVAVGTDGQYLKADSGATAGVSWATLPAAGAMVLLVAESFTTASAYTKDSVFTSTYRNYFIALDVTAASTALDIESLFRTSGSDNTNSSYKGASIGLNGANNNSANQSSSGTTKISFGLGCNANGLSARIWLNQPQISQRTSMLINNAHMGNYAQFANWLFDATTQFDGIKFAPASGTFTGTVRIYGLVDS